MDKALLDMLLHTPPTGYREVAEHMTLSDLHLACSSLDHLIEYAARLSSYLECRMYHQSHAASVVRCNRVVRNVRGALGYTTTNDLEF